METPDREERKGVRLPVDEEMVKRLATARVESEINRRKAQAYVDGMFRKANNWPAGMLIPHVTGVDGLYVHRVYDYRILHGDTNEAYPILPLDPADVAIWTADREARGLSTFIPDDPWDMTAEELNDPKNPNSPLYG